MERSDHKLAQGNIYRDEIFLNLDYGGNYHHNTRLSGFVNSKIYTKEKHSVFSFICYKTFFNYLKKLKMMIAFDEAFAYICLSKVSHFLSRKKITLQILSKVLYVVFVKTFKCKPFIISIHFSNFLFHASKKIPYYS